MKYVLLLAITLVFMGCSFKNGGYYLAPKVSSCTGKPILLKASDVCKDLEINYIKSLNSDSYECFINNLYVLQKYCK